MRPDNDKPRLSLEDIEKRLPNYIKYIRYCGNWYHEVQCTLCSKKMMRLPHNFKFNCKCNGHNGKKKRESILKVNSNFNILNTKERGILMECSFCKNIIKRKGADVHRGCQICKNGIKTTELEIKDFLLSIGVDTNKKRIDRKEIDLFSAPYQIGIEYCGLYWHSEGLPSSRNKKHIYDKFIFFKKKDIRIITIFEDEWLDRKGQVKGFLRSVFNKNEIKVNARDCTVRFITKEESYLFLDIYHIQGKSTGSTVNIGIFYKNELMGVISAGRHHRIRNNDLVLQRMCFKENVTVRGGASRMFKRLVQFAKENSFSKIVSWSDNRWSEGDVYRILGFEKSAELSPDYSYFKKLRRFSKQSLKKTEEERRSELTEYQLRLKQGFDRIWDCGKIRWLYTIN